jgi:hypothetical protein
MTDTDLGVGCWISGWWGQYAPDRLVQLVTGALKWDGDKDDGTADPVTRGLIALCDARLETIGGSNDIAERLYQRQLRYVIDTCNAQYDRWNPAEEDVTSMVYDLADECEDRLRRALPEGWSCGWSDGEFYVFDTEWPEEA